MRLRDHFSVAGRNADRFFYEILNYFCHHVPMKFMLALASGWIAFYLADQAIYDGDHARLVAGFLGAIVAGFG
jgi:hypothetical protein